MSKYVTVIFKNSDKSETIKELLKAFAEGTAFGDAEIEVLSQGDEVIPITETEIAAAEEYKVLDE